MTVKDYLLGRVGRETVAETETEEETERSGLCKLTN